MLNRRKRLIVHTATSNTLFNIREALGRSVELIVAADSATVEAALRLYQQIAALIVEKKPNVRLNESTLKLARDILPQMPRVALVDFEAVGDAQSALSSGLVTRLVFMPFGPAELASAVNAEVPACSPRLNRHLRAG